jgi:DNA-binding NarL/FixJ family response regulator
MSRRSRPRRNPLYNGTAPAVAGSATSEGAARAIEGKRPSKRQLVYGYILSRGAEGATRKEIAVALGMSENTVRPRVVELYNTWNTTHGVPDVKESPDGRARAGCAVLLAAPFYPHQVDAFAWATGQDDTHAA